MPSKPSIMNKSHRLHVVSRSYVAFTVTIQSILTQGLASILSDIILTLNRVQMYYKCHDRVGMY